MFLNRSSDAFSRYTHRDPSPFVDIASWVRYGSEWIAPGTMSGIKAMQREARFYNIAALQGEALNFYPVRTYIRMDAL